MVAELSLSEVEFHDAYWVDFVYLRCQRVLRMSFFSLLDRHGDAVIVDLEFQGVSFVFMTDLQPWGPSNYIDSASSAELPPVTRSEAQGWELPEDVKMLHIVAQSGDDLYIGYENVVIRARE